MAKKNNNNNTKQLQVCMDLSLSNPIHLINQSKNVNPKSNTEIKKKRKEKGSIQNLNLTDQNDIQLRGPRPAWTSILCVCNTSGWNPSSAFFRVYPNGPKQIRPKLCNGWGQVWKRPKRPVPSSHPFLFSYGGVTLEPGFPRLPMSWNWKAWVVWLKKIKRVPFWKEGGTTPDSREKPRHTNSLYFFYHFSHHSFIWLWNGGNTHTNKQRKNKKIALKTWHHLDSNSL